MAGGYAERPSRRPPTMTATPQTRKVVQCCVAPTSIAGNHPGAHVTPCQRFMGSGGLACSNKAKKGSKIWKEGLEGPRDRSDGSQRLLRGVWNDSDSQWLAQLLLSAKVRLFLSRTVLFSREFHQIPSQTSI